MSKAGALLADQGLCKIRTSDGQMVPMDGFLHLTHGPKLGNTCVYRQIKREPGVMDATLSQCASVRDGSIVTKTEIADVGGVQSCVLRFAKNITPAELEDFQQRARSDALSRTSLYVAEDNIYQGTMRRLRIVQAEVEVQTGIEAAASSKLSDLRAKVRKTAAENAEVKQQRDRALDDERVVSGELTALQARIAVLQDPELVSAEAERRKATFIAVAEASQRDAEERRRPKEPPRRIEHPTQKGRYLAYKSDTGELYLSRDNVDTAIMRVVIKYGAVGLKQPRSYSALQDVASGTHFHAVAQGPPDMRTGRLLEATDEMSWLVYDAPSGGTALRTVGGMHVGYDAAQNKLQMVSEFHPNNVNWNFDNIVNNNDTDKRTLKFGGRVGLSVVMNQIDDLTKRVFQSIQRFFWKSMADDEWCSPTALLLTRQDLSERLVGTKCIDVAAVLNDSISQVAKKYQQQGWLPQDIGELIAGVQAVWKDLSATLCDAKTGLLDTARAAEAVVALQTAFVCAPLDTDTEWTQKGSVMGFRYATNNAATAKVIKRFQDRVLTKFQATMCKNQPFDPDSFNKVKRKTIVDNLSTTPRPCTSISNWIDNIAAQSRGGDDLKDAWKAASTRICSTDGQVDPRAVDAFLRNAYSAVCSTDTTATTGDFADI